MDNPTDSVRTAEVMARAAATLDKLRRAHVHALADIETLRSELKHSRMAAAFWRNAYKQLHREARQ